MPDAEIKIFLSGPLRLFSFFLRHLTSSQIREGFIGRPWTVVEVVLTNTWVLLLLLIEPNSFAQKNVVVELLSGELSSLVPQISSCTML